MATYKVIQDIEAEDKLIGWMTPRQTIYVAIVFMTGFIWWMFVNAGAWWLGLIFVPHMALLLLLSSPFGHDQSSEVWLLAKIKFYLQPNRRIWDQSGVKELVTITVPKKIEKQYTDGLNQDQVRSRLSALASTLDSRGWAIKNVGINPYNQMGFNTGTDDRLINTASMPQPVSDADFPPQNDILDGYNNPIAHQLDNMIVQSTEAHRQQVLQSMQAASSTQENNDWQINPTPVQQYAQPLEQAFANSSPADNYPLENIVTPPPYAINPTEQQDQDLILEEIKEHQRNRATDNMRTIKTLDEQQEEARRNAAELAKIKNQQLSTNNDRTVESLARQANKPDDEPDDGEVVISLR